MSMTYKQRLLTALDHGTPDRLPVTTHHLMTYFLDKYMDGASNREFFDCFDLDAIYWAVPHQPDPAKGEYFDPRQGPLGFLESQRIASDQWHWEFEAVPDPQYQTTRYHAVTPKGTLTMMLQSNEHTAWVSEPLIKRSAI